MSGQRRRARSSDRNPEGLPQPHRTRRSLTMALVKDEINFDVDTFTQVSLRSAFLDVTSRSISRSGVVETLLGRLSRPFVGKQILLHTG